MIASAAGLIAAALVALVPAKAENPMTPARPVAPEQSAASLPVPASPAAAADPALMPDNAATADIGPTPQRRGPRDRQRAAGGIKPGRWALTARLQPATGTSPRGQAASGGMAATYTTCIDSDNAVPADLGPQCRLQRNDQRGSQISWSMSCANTGVHANGLARYRGDTMEATVVSHIPAAAGRVTQMTQHLTGRYIGPCSPAAAAVEQGGPPTPAAAAANSRPPAAARENASSTRPAAGSTTAAAPSADANPSLASEAAPSRLESRHHQPHHRRHARRSHRRHHGRSAHRAWFGGASSLGPPAYSNSGP